MGRRLIAKTLVLIFCMVALCRCAERPEVPHIRCAVEASFSEYPDSSFFKDISCMYVQGHKLYMFDPTRGDVAVKGVASDSLFYTIGKIGQGPNEVVSPTGFWVLPDGEVALQDAAGYIKVYDNDDCKRQIETPAANEKRFFMDDGYLYVSAVTDTSCYAKCCESWKRGSLEGIQLYGNLFELTELPDMNYIRNSRHLVKGEGCLYAVCPSYQVVEKYDLSSGRLLETCDLSEVDIIAEALKDIQAEPSSPKSFSVFLKDVYWQDHVLYLLCAQWAGGYTVNRILALDCIPSLKPRCVYELPGRIYSSFAIDENRIYAMNYETSSVQILFPSGSK